MSSVPGVLLSLKPEFAYRLLAGAKTAEVRRRFPLVEPGTDVYVYASSPIRAVIGTLHLDAVHGDTPENLWQRFGTRLDISRDFFDSYLEGRRSAVVIELRPNAQWAKPVTLDALRSRVKLQPPQSFRYLTPEHIRLLEGGRL